MIYLYLTVGLILLLPFTWVLYVAIMNFKEHKDKMGRVSLAIAYPLLWVGLVSDILFNFTWGSILFLEPPRELLMTTRLKRHLGDRRDNWRDDMALWFCKEFLDIYDPSGKHC